MSIRDNINELIKLSGGEVVDNRFVTKPGVMMISKTVNMIPESIASLFNLTDDNKQLAELNARITYMHFKEAKDDYLEEIVNVKKHQSILSNINLGFLVAGVKGETVLEFVSSSANISRQTTSRTISANDTLYVASVEDIPFIEEYLRLRDNYLDHHQEKRIRMI